MKSGTTIFLASLLLVTIGLAIGYFIGSPPGVDDVPDAPDKVQATNSIVELNEKTMENMNLVTGKFEIREYAQAVTIPATIVERLPIGRQRLTVPVNSRVKSVLISPGQSVRPGQPLFELEVTDQELSQVQVEILSVDSEIGIAKEKMARLIPLVKSGAVAGTRLLDVEFELKKLNARKRSLAQKLQVSGMSIEQIHHLLDSGKMVRNIRVDCPELDTPKDEGKVEDYRAFTVESIDALAGDNVQRGEYICQLTYHGQLLIKGIAFESDIDQIMNSTESRMFTAVFGESPNTSKRENLKLNSIDNHVDDKSQTFSIYVELNNEIAGKNTDSQGREYTHWRFKPGSRAHLEYPIRKWEDQIVVPLEALVREGAETFVFQKMNHSHETPEGTIFEFIKRPVKVLFEDRTHAVLEKQSSLDIYEEYALNLAYQLNLALKQAAAGGGGHSHDHEH